MQIFFKLEIYVYYGQILDFDIGCIKMICFQKYAFFMDRDDKFSYEIEPFKKEMLVSEAHVYKSISSIINILNDIIIDNTIKIVKYYRRSSFADTTKKFLNKMEKSK